MISYSKGFEHDKKDLLFDIQIWRVDDVAGFLKCSKGHVYNLVNQRRIPFRKRGKMLFFLPTEILEWIEVGYE